MNKVNVNYQIPKNAIRYWTRAAIECYEIGCTCSKCNINKIIETKCFMKNIVIALVKEKGIPKKFKLKEE